MHEPDGYRGGQRRGDRDRGGDSDGRLVAFCRVEPATPARSAEARRCLDAGARGIKLHPRAESSRCPSPAVRELVALAHERGVPVLIHAGRGIPALGRGHGAAGRRVPGRAADPRPRRDLRPGVAVARAAASIRTCSSTRRGGTRSTSSPLFSLCRAGQVLWASDSPYGLPLVGAAQTLRCALPGRADRRAGARCAWAARWSDAGRRGPARPRAAPGPRDRARPAARARRLSHLGGGRWAGPSCGSTSPSRSGSRGWPAPSATTAAGRADLQPRCSSCSTSSTALAPPEDGRPIPVAARFLVAALFVARTPDVPLRPLPGARTQRAPTPRRTSHADPRRSLARVQQPGDHQLRPSRTAARASPSC